jgi:class 3 adenylate cyclase
MAGHDLLDNMRASIERTLLDQGRRNELIIAYVRAASLLVFTAMSWIGSLEAREWFELPSIPLPLLPTGWLAVSIALALLLRRGWYHPSLRFLIPLADALLISSIGGYVWYAVGSDAALRMGVDNRIGIGCALLAATGALRLTWPAALLTSFLALAVHGVFAFALSTLGDALFSSSMLLGFGMLSVWMTRIVRRAMRSEVGRVTLGRFLPRSIVEDAHHDPLALVAEPRLSEVTVLVSDLRGFTAFAESQRPAAVMDFLNEVQGSFAAVVRRHGGTVDKFMGDGMLAVFGAPEPLAEHALLAVLAARGIRAAMEKINAARAARGEPTLRVGIGIHSGTVVAGCLGNNARLEFTVVGDTVNTASRLEALTKEHDADVLVSEDAVRRLPTSAALDAGRDLRPLGEIALRGRKDGVRVFALIA